MKSLAKVKTCKICKSKFRPFNTMAVVCSIECGVEKYRRDRAKEHRKAKAEANNQHIPTLKARAQRYCNKYIRMRDKDDGCISCDKPASWDTKWQAGHYRSVGAEAALRYDEQNIHKQCLQCNMHKSSNSLEYRPRLVKKIGIEEVERIENHNVRARFRSEDYLRIIEYYKGKIKQLNSERGDK